MKLKKTKTRLILEQVEILEAGSEGNCIAKVDDLVVFVPFVVPGDVVDLEVYRKKKNFAQAKAVKFHKYSPLRVEPLCEHFTVCGGCKWQTMNYESQVFYKQKQVRDNLERIAKADCSHMLTILPSEKTSEYRNKLEYTFSTKAWVENYDKTMPARGAFGFHVPGFFDKVLDIGYCALQREPSNEIRNHLRTYCSEHALPYYDIRNHEGLMRNLIIRTTGTVDLMVIVVFASQSEEIIPLLEDLKTNFPQITSLMYCVNEKFNDTLGDQNIILYSGKDFMEERMAAFDGGEALRFKIRPKTFYQTNSLQAERLYRQAAEFAEITKEDTVYDLYTGCGTIANYIARSAKKVVGVEYVEDAVEDARSNAEYNGINNAVFHAGDMAKILDDDFVTRNGRPQIIITDPPRAGMAESVVKQILKIAPRKIVYISCNPATQARDIFLLKEKYNVGRIRPVDMFPHTQHVENVVELILKQD